MDSRCLDFLRKFYRRATKIFSLKFARKCIHFVLLVDIELFYEHTKTGAEEARPQFGNIYNNMENVLGTSGLLWHTLQSSVGHSYGSFDNPMKVILGRETKIGYL
jgi:hypothetical protein